MSHARSVQRSYRRFIHAHSPDRNFEYRIPGGTIMKFHPAFIAPAAGIAVVLSSVAAFGTAFGILVGLGLATATIAAGSLILSGDTGSKEREGPSATSLHGTTVRHC